MSATGGNDKRMPVYAYMDPCFCTARILIPMGTCDGLSPVRVSVIRNTLIN